MVSSLLVGDYKRIIIEMNSRVVIDLVLDELIMPNDFFFELLQSYKGLMTLY